MSQALMIRLDKPIVATRLLDGDPRSEDSPSSTHAPADSGTQAECIATGGSDTSKTAFSQACQTLNDVIDKLNDLYAKLFTQHAEAIARLSLEIARKVLMQKVEKGDYEIVSLVKEAIMHAPSRHDLVVHLSPDDLEQCRKARQHDEQDDALAGIKLVPDPNIGRAECLIESPKGIIKSLIDENLDRIGRALTKEQ